MNGPAYVAWFIVAVCCALFFWRGRIASDERTILIPFAAMIGGILGAKVAYLLAEGLQGDAVSIRELLTGKSVLGGLLGGYLAVELAKRLLKVSRNTGDIFAASVPIGIALGRLGCLANGCCLGVKWTEGRWFTLLAVDGSERWPAVPIEIVFNLAFAFVLWQFRRKNIFCGQHFHIYLVCYGVFRFFTEFLRDTPKTVGLFSGYQLIAVIVVLFGITAFVKRASAATSPLLPEHR